MRPKRLSYTPADDDADGFANNVTASAGEALTLAATTAADGMAHLVIITPSGSVSGSYTLTGTDADGKAQTETLATDTTNAVTSAKYYKTLTEVLAPSGIGAETVDIGWTDDIVSPSYPLNYRAAREFNVSLGVDISGTINYTVQHLLTDPQSAAPSTLTWWNHEYLVSQTTDQDGNYAFPVTAVRLLINSLTAGATIALNVIQGG